MSIARGVTCALLLSTWALAAEPGKAVGTFTYDSTPVTLAHAVEKKVEGLFDSSKQDTLVVLSDKPLGSTAPDDDIELSLRARKGDIAALMLRIDGAKLVNVSVFHKGLAGKVLLPGAWFDYKASKPGTGTLKMSTKDFDGHKYAANVEFAAIAAPKPAPAPEPVAPPAPARPAPVTAPPAAAPKPAPATPPSADLFAAMLMRNDEAAALEIIKMGLDPNGKDKGGMPVLSWAITTCKPKLVQALVDRKANVNIQRAPGLTTLVEAGACPDAAKILKAAGAK